MGIWLVMETAGGGERQFPIRKPRTVIGRDVFTDVRIPIPSVAPRHCELTIGDDDELHLTDLGSDRGTLHNGAPVSEAILVDTDRVTIGPVTFRVQKTPEGADAEASGNPARQPRASQPRASQPPRGGAITTEPKIPLRRPQPAPSSE